MEIDTTRWTEEQIAAYKAAERALAVEQAAADKATSAATSAAMSPEVALLKLRIQTDEARRERERAEREAADERAWLEMQAKYGARCRKVYTEAGTIIVTATTEVQWDAAEARAKSLAEGFLNATPPDYARAESESVKAMREAHFKHLIVHPATDVAREILKAYPAAWNDVYAARRELFRGAVTAAGKGAAR